MRILRIFKLVRHFAGLQSLLSTLQQAYKVGQYLLLDYKLPCSQELGLLMHLVMIALLLFSSAVYFAEKDSTDHMKVPTSPFCCLRLTDDMFFFLSQSWTFGESFWWGLMTLTTVGYELAPTTALGKVIGGLCALSGTFILTLPIPIVVNSFATYYKDRIWRTEVEIFEQYVP